MQLKTIFQEFHSQALSKGTNNFLYGRQHKITEAETEPGPNCKPLWSIAQAIIKGIFRFIKLVIVNLVSAWRTGYAFN